LFKQWLKVGPNEVVIRFTSNYVRDCQGVQYFKDKDDGEEYLYSDHEPASCHRGFPCFDQPDIKATYSMMTVVPKGWHVMSNAEQHGSTHEVGSEGFSSVLKAFRVSEKEFISGFGDEPVCCFEFK